MGQLVIFPLAYRVRLVRRIVDVWSRTPTQSRRKLYLLRRKSDLTKRLQQQGFEQADIDLALDDLWRAVKREHWRRTLAAAHRAKGNRDDG